MDERIQERRELNKEIISFMACAEEKLNSIHDDISELNNKVGIQNGRIVNLEMDRAVFRGILVLSWAVFGALLTIAGIMAVWFHK